MLTIRKAVLTDAEQIARIHAESWRAAYHSFIPENFFNNKANLESRRELWNRLLSQEHDSHFAMENDGEIIGFFSLKKARDADLPENTCELVAIYFAPHSWHQGCGSQAMQFILSRAKEQGYKRIVLWVLEKNAPARAFYEKWDFRFDGKTNVLPLGVPTVECRYELQLKN